MSDDVVTLLLLAVGTGTLTWFVIVPLISAIPHRMEVEWQREVAKYAGTSLQVNDSRPQLLSLQHKLLVCAVAMLIAALMMHVRGVSNTTAVLLAYLLGVLLLAAINWRTALLPDKIVLPLLWGGLLYSAASGRGVDQIYGAAIGFGMPWLLYWAIKLKTGTQTIGYGDMKTFAMAGAWFGVAAMPTLFVTFCASLILLLLVIKATGLQFPKSLPVGHFIPTGFGHLVSSVAWLVGVQLI